LVTSEVNLGASGSVTIPRGQLKNLKASYTLTESRSYRAAEKRPGGRDD
jgi:hypothetical protein